MDAKKAGLWEKIAKERRSAFEQLRQGQANPSQFFALFLYSAMAVGSLALQLFWILSIVGLWLLVVAARVVLWSVQKSFKLISKQDWKAIWVRIAGGQGIPTPGPIPMTERREGNSATKPADGLTKSEKRSA